MLVYFHIFARIVYPFILTNIIDNLTNNNIEQFIFTGFILLFAHLIGNTISFLKVNYMRKYLEEAKKVFDNTEVATEGKKLVLK